MTDGWQKLKEDVLSSVWHGCEEKFAQASGDSPIERLLMAALIVRVQFGFGDVRRLGLYGGSTEDRATILGQGDRPLIIERQKKLPWGRVDFFIAFHSERFDEAGEPEWHFLVVECDGHEFHERTKEQASKDRERDRKAQMAGYTVFRFTGRDIWRDAWGCAGQVLAWAQQRL